MRWQPRFTRPGESRRLVTDHTAISAAAVTPHNASAPSAGNEPVGTNRRVSVLNAADAAGATKRIAFACPAASLLATITRNAVARSAAPKDRNAAAWPEANR